MKISKLKLVTARVLAFSAFTVLLASTSANASLVTGNATITIDADAVVAATPANGWYFADHWGASDNTLPIDGATTGGTALSTTGLNTMLFPVNTNTTPIIHPNSGFGRTVQATTMDANDTSAGQIGLSGALRMRAPGLTTYLAPYDLTLAKTAGDWGLVSHDTGFPNGPLFTLTNVSESLNLNGELLLSGDLLFTGGFAWSSLIGADTSTVVGSFNLSPSPVPVPAAVWLFGSGLLGLVGATRKKSLVTV